jgi:pSer/pThr/pTyr-binding forkhead associated (FHA) protein
MPPPRKQTSSSEHDPERENRTQARARAPADDPERENRTQARARAPADDPERENRTQARARAPADDPERANRTQARVKRPRARAAPDDVSEYRTASEYGDDESGAYRTGHNYQAVEGEDEEGLSGQLNLDGDGLDALDPEVGSSTKAMPALEPQDEAPADDEEGADDANATRAGPPIKLEIIAGPDAGKKKRFKGVRMIIGRTPGVDLLLSDQSVSRRHVELIHGDDGVVMRDLGSGNGTKVNGTRVAEKKLEHGDEIAIGKTKIRFVDEVAAFRKMQEEAEKREAEQKAAAEKAAAPSETSAVEGEGDGEAQGDGGASDGEGGTPERKPTGTRSRPVRRAREAADGGGFVARFKALPKPMQLGLAGGVGVVLLIFVLGIALRPPPPPPVDPNKIIAESKMQDARNAAREGDFARVIQLVGEAEKLQPGIDKTKLAAQAQAELAIVQALDEARAAMEARRFDDARKLLDKAGAGSVKTDERKSALRAELEVAEVKAKLEKVEEYLAAGDVEAARSLLIELPHEQQVEPARKIAEFERELEEQRALEKKEGARAAAAAAAAKKARREQEMIEAFLSVERKFAGAEWDRAASECGRVIDAYPKDPEIAARARKVQGLIPAFGRAYDEGMKKFRQGQLSQAAKPLNQAYQLYGQLGLKANKFGQELEEKLGAAAIAAGREAVLRNDLATAFQMFKSAARFDPGDTRARQGLDDVLAKAEDLFQEGYMLRDRDPREAIRKFTTVVRATDPGTTVHEKAKNQLAAMAP